MASMGLQGGTARCYDWWMDYLKVNISIEHYITICHAVCHIV